MKVPVELPAGEEWLLWRVITDKRTKSSRKEIEEEWSFEEAYVAYEVYEALDDAERRANAQQNPRT